jgi:hypothetical protein
MPSARSHSGGCEASRPPDADGLGSRVSPGNLLRCPDLERLIHDRLQTGALPLKLFQPLRVIGLHLAVLVAPAVKRLLADLDRPSCLGDRLASPSSRSASRSFRITYSGVCSVASRERSSVIHDPGRETLSQVPGRIPGVRSERLAAGAIQIRKQLPPIDLFFLWLKA